MLTRESPEWQLTIAFWECLKAVNALTAESGEKDWHPVLAQSDRLMNAYPQEREMIRNLANSLGKAMFVYLHDYDRQFLPTEETIEESGSKSEQMDFSCISV